jgi:hypothetical protein
MGRWCQELGCPRRDVIERWLYRRWKKSEPDQALFTRRELESILNAMSATASRSPGRAVDVDFRNARTKIEGLLEEVGGTSVGCPESPKHTSGWNDCPSGR